MKKQSWIEPASVDSLLSCVNRDDIVLLGAEEQKVFNLCGGLRETANKGRGATSQHRENTIYYERY